MNTNMTNQELIRDFDYILYALGETLCYAKADPDCDADEIPELVFTAQEILLNLRSFFNDKD
jgi:hypothetical protein